ncbi:serine/arginine repetitive matrix protein 1-like [Branchiostoma floridae]|uniref:Serine/arginine repetitive matrix protein 1-like n=1 Tax=Branchiostoma floridae TaxID=7739 RepID=A0A9J7N4W4_BRAFL|nr:serine/arginine repetitive matrix protein 1-like [Branchiostoma floridae]
MPLKYLRKRGLVLKKWTFRHFGRLKRKKRSSSPSSNESSPSQRRKQEDDQGTVAADDEFDFPNIEAHKLDTSVARGKAELSKRRSTKPRRKPTRQRSTSGNEDSNDFGFSIAPEAKENRQPAISNELNGSVDSLDRDDVFNQNTVAASVSPNRQPSAASAALGERLPSPDWVTVSFAQGQEPQMSPTKPLTEPSPKASPNRSPRSSPIPAKEVSKEDQPQSSPAWTKIIHSSSQDSKGSLVKQQSMPEPAGDPLSPEWTTITHRQSVQERHTISSKVKGFALPGLTSGGSSRSGSNKPSPASPEHFLQSPTAGSPQARPAASPTKTGVLIPGLEELESSPVKLKHTPTKEKYPSPPEEATVPSWAKDTQLKKVRTPEEMSPPEEPEEKEGPWTKQAQLKKVESPPSKEDDEEMAKENEPPEQDWRARLKKSFKSGGKDTKKEKTQEKAAPDWAKKAEEKTKRMQTMVESSAEREKSAERAAPDWAKQAEEKTKRVQTITELSKEKEVERAAPDWAKQAEEKTKRVLDIAESSRDKQPDQSTPEWANRAKHMTARVKSNKVLVELETKKENSNVETNLPPLKQLARTPESNGEFDARNGDKTGSWFSETKLKKTRPGSGSGGGTTESAKSPSWIEQSRKKSQRCNALIETADPEKRLERKLSGSADEEPKAPFVREVSLRSRKNSDKSGGDISPGELAQIPDWKVQLQKRKKEQGAAEENQSRTPTTIPPDLQSNIEKQYQVSKSAENLLDVERAFIDPPRCSETKPSVESEKTDSCTKEKVTRVKSCPENDPEKEIHPVKKLFKQFSAHFFTAKAPEVRGDPGTKSHLDELKGRDSQVSAQPVEEPVWKKEIRRRKSQVRHEGYTEPSEPSATSPPTLPPGNVPMPPKSKEAEEPPPEPAWKRELSRRRREGRYQTQIITSDSKDSPDSPANWLQKLRSRPQSAAPSVDLTTSMQAEPVWKQEAERKRNRFQTALAENLS